MSNRLTQYRSLGYALRAAAILTILGLTSPPGAAQDLSPREIAARARPAVVVITALDGAVEVGQGSGFLVSEDGRIVSNRHVLEGATRLRVQLSTGEIYDRVFFIGADDRRDLVVLRIPATGMRPLPFGDDRAIEVGDPVYVMGNPLGLEGTFSDGLVSGKRTVDGVALIQISAPISPGSSGGPVLNDRGEVIGVATSTVHGAQNLNIAVPARYVAGMLAIDQEPRPFREVATRFSPAASSGEGTPARAQSEREPWAQVLAEEMALVAGAADELGFVETHEPAIEMIREGETYAIDYEFDEAGQTITFIAVCDIDCTDIDLAVYDGSGDIIVKDIALDDRPEVEFDVITPGIFQVGVYMASCSREPCAFAVRAYKHP